MPVSPEDKFALIKQKLGLSDQESMSSNVSTINTKAFVYASGLYFFGLSQICQRRTMVTLVHE